MARAKKSDILSELIRERDPDTEKLAQLVAKAKGDRTVSEFAAVCGVNPSTMSRLINGKNSTASSDELIVAIAMNADPRSGVRFQDLVNAHGMFILFEDDYEDAYIARKYEDIFDGIVRDAELSKKISRNPVGFVMEAEKLIREIITSELMERGYTVGLQMDTSIMRRADFPYYADFILKTNALEKEEISGWAFDVKVGKIRQHGLGRFGQIFSAAYLDSPRDAGIRVTMAVCDKVSYQLLREELKGLRIWDSVSLMWVDMQQRKVVAEYVINTKAGVNVVRLFDEGEETDYQELYGVPEEDC